MDRTSQQSRRVRTVSIGALAKGELISDRYRVARRIGEGAYGTVYEVEHIALGKRFALKVLNPQSRQNWRTISRFQAEAVTASKIDHPNIVSVTDVGRTANDQAYYVMELLEGETLGEVLKREKRLSLSRAIPILAATAHGLHAAHEAGVIHRDLKPENVFLVPEEEAQSGRTREIVRILDFGLAKVMETPGVTIDGITYGTPGYMAPEQIRGEEVDRRADIYSVGCIAYEMFAGKPLFTGPPLEVALAHCEQAPPQLTAAPSPRMRWVIERCLDKDPDKRFNDCHELLQELRECAIEVLTPDGKTRKIDLMPTDAEVPGSKDSWSCLSDSGDDSWWDEFSSVVQQLGASNASGDLTPPPTGEPVITPPSLSGPLRASGSISDGSTLVDDQSPFGDDDQPTDVAPKHGYGAQSRPIPAAAPEPAGDPARARQPSSPELSPIAGALDPLYHAQEHTLQVGRSVSEEPIRRPMPAFALALVAVAAAIAVLLAAVLYKIVQSESSTGALIVNVNPEDTKLAIGDVPQSTTGPTRVFNDLPTGNTAVKASRPRCKPATKSAVIRAGRVQVLNFKLHCKK